MVIRINEGFSLYNKDIDSRTYFCGANLTELMHELTEYGYTVSWQADEFEGDELWVCFPSEYIQ